MTPLYELIYTSTLADDAHPGCVADIVRAARSFNDHHGITGILMFDGAHFCQYLEGAAATLHSLIERIRNDVRHTHFVVKHEGHFSEARRFPDKPLAFGLDEHGTIIEKLIASFGRATAVLLFDSLPNIETE
jgi:Sensors of blue-light using FAD